MNTTNSNEHNAKLFLAAGFAENASIIYSISSSDPGYQGLEFCRKTGRLRFVVSADESTADFIVQVKITCELESIDQALELLAKQFRCDLYGHLPNQDNDE